MVNMKKEYATCLLDPVYTIENYFKVFNNVKGENVPFKLLSNQKRVIEGYENNRLNLVKKYRQAGISKIDSAYLSHKAAFCGPEKPELIMVVSNRLDLSKRLLDDMRQLLLSLPRWVWGSEYYGNEENMKKSIFTKNTKTEIELANGSRIKAVSSSVTAFRGWSPTYILLDEAAFIDRNDELFVGCFASIAVGGRVMMVSTPNGLDRLFHQTYMGILRGKNDFNLIELNWWEDERFNKDLRWILTKDNKIVDSITDVLPQYYDKVLLAGYKPTNGWYKSMSTLVGNDERRISQEIGGEFII